MAKLSNAVKAARVVHNINKAALEIKETVVKASYKNYVSSCIRKYGEEKAREMAGYNWWEVTLCHIPGRSNYEDALNGYSIYLDEYEFKRHNSSFYTWSAREICDMFYLSGTVVSFDLSGMTTERVLAYLYDMGFSSVEYAKNFLLIDYGKRISICHAISARIKLMYIAELISQHGWQEFQRGFIIHDDISDIDWEWFRYTRDANQTEYLPRFDIQCPWTVDQIKPKKTGLLSSIANVFDGMITGVLAAI